VINALSIDVEDWFQVSDFEEEVRFAEWDQYEARVLRNTRRLLTLMAEHNVRGTFFILTWNAERFPQLVREIDAAGHEIATHGYAHRLIYTQTPQEFREDIQRSLEILQGITGKKVLGYRAPSFSITSESLWALDILLELGLQYDSSIFPLRDKLYGIADSYRFPYVIRQHGARSLVEFPMSTVRLLRSNLPLAGGAYFRLLPYGFFRWGMKRLNRDGRSAILYLHPWEIDPDQPRISTRGKRGYSSHYLNLHRTEKKLVHLLRDFSFAPITEVLAPIFNAA
jgi:polysaccharide deacetylase family protein (PEP-CTERM system associated)